MAAQQLQNPDSSSWHTLLLPIHYYVLAMTPQG